MRANHRKYADNPEDREEKLDELTAWLGQALNLVVYLSSERPDIEREDAPAPPAKPRPGQASSARVKALAPLKVWNVGFREGATWRAANAAAEERSASTANEGEEEVTRRPHWRNAHWHRFWVGAHDTEDRRLTVKWVGQTLINAKHHRPERGDELPVVRRSVRP